MRRAGGTVSIGRQRGQSPLKEVLPSYLQRWMSGLGMRRLRGRWKTSMKYLRKSTRATSPFPPKWNTRPMILTALTRHKLRNLLTTKFLNPLNMSNPKSLLKRIPEGEESESGRNLHMFNASETAREVQVVEKEAPLFQKEYSFPRR